MIVQSTADIKKFYPVTEDFSYDDLLPFMNSSLERYIYPYLSKAMYNVLNVVDLTTLSTANKNLLPYVQRAITMIALHKYAAVGDKLVGKNGISTNETEMGKMAAQWRLNNMAQFCLDEYDEAIEHMLIFLEENKASYSTWATSSAFTQYKEGFITTTDDFDMYFKIGRSRRTFVSFRGFIKQVEDQYIRSVTGSALFDQIKTQIAAGTVSVNNSKLLTLIRPAVAKLTGARALRELPVSITDAGVVIKTQSSSLTTDATEKPDPIMISARIQMAESDAQDYLGRLRKLLYANHADYPLYEADSTVYNGGKAVDINENNGTFFF